MGWWLDGCWIWHDEYWCFVQFEQHCSIGKNELILVMILKERDGGTVCVCVGGGVRVL